MPYGLAFMLTTAVRFLLQLTEEIGTVVAVQRLRGINPVRVSRKSVTHIINLLTPVLANAVNRAATLGASCEGRAFNLIIEIPRDTVVQHCEEKNVTVVEGDPQSHMAEAYRRLAEVVRAEE